MKKLLILVFFVTACSKLEFQYNSNLDYTLYPKAYVLAIYNEINSIYFNEADMMNIFCNELDKKSGFNTIYNYYNRPDLADSILSPEYLEIRLYVTRGEYKFKEIEHDNGNVSFYYEANITVSCETYRNNKLVFQIENTSEYDHEYDYDDSGNFDEVKGIALERSLQEIAKYFTKSYVI